MATTAIVGGTVVTAEDRFRADVHIRDGIVVGLGLDLPARFDVCGRSRRSVALDLKHPDAVACILDLVRGADALIEGFRPGTTERLEVATIVSSAITPTAANMYSADWVNASS